MKKKLINVVILILFFISLCFFCNYTKVIKGENDITIKEEKLKDEDNLTTQQNSKIVKNDNGSIPTTNSNIDNSNIDNTNNNNKDIEDLISKIKKPQNLDFYKKTMTSYMNLNNNNIELRNEDYEVNNKDGIIFKKEHSLINGNIILTKYDLNTNKTECSMDNEKTWNEINNTYFEESNQLFSDLSTYSIQETNDEYILTSSNLDFIKNNDFLINVTTLDNPTRELKGCYLSILIDKNTFCIKNYNIYVNYTILNENEVENIEIVAKCNYYDIKE